MAKVCFYAHINTCSQHILFTLQLSMLFKCIYLYILHIYLKLNLLYSTEFLLYSFIFPRFFVNHISVEMRGSFDFFFFAFLSSSGVSLKSPHNLCKTVAKLHHRKIHFNYIYQYLGIHSEYIYRIHIQNTFYTYVFMYVVSWKVSLAELILRYDCIMSRLSTYKKKAQDSWPKIQY